MKTNMNARERQKDHDEMREKRYAMDKKKSNMAIEIIQLNKEIKRISSYLDEQTVKLEEFKNKFPNQKLINSKIELIKRVVVASKYGLERQNVRLYDIDERELE